MQSNTYNLMKYLTYIAIILLVCNDITAREYKVFGPQGRHRMQGYF